jgi:hypothetical protein
LGDKNQNKIKRFFIAEEASGAPGGFRRLQEAQASGGWKFFRRQFNLTKKLNSRRHGMVSTPPPRNHRSLHTYHFHRSKCPRR